MKVGFIGLGRMGQGMARRILGAGHELSVFDMVAAADGTVSERPALAWLPRSPISVPAARLS